MALVALVISRWRLLGAQGSQVATAAFFAFATYTGASSDTDQVKELGQIVLLVLIGSAVGVGVNVLIAPPLRYRSAEWGIRALAQEIHDLLDTMAPELGEGAPDADTTQGWRDRADRTGTLISQSREGLRTARESLRLNPHPWARRRRGTLTFEAYDRTMEALVRMISQVTAITRSLDLQHQDEKQQEEESGPDRDYAPFLRAYATFLSSVVDFTEILATLDEDHLRDQAGRLDEAADGLERCRREVVRTTEDRGLSLTDPTEPYGVLVVEATRLSEECRYTADVLGNSAENGSSGSRTA
nr:hypothetical protein [Streptomyces albidoflavus]